MKGAVAWKERPHHQRLAERNDEVLRGFKEEGIRGFLGMSAIILLEGRTFGI